MLSEVEFASGTYVRIHPTIDYTELNFRKQIEEKTFLRSKWFLEIKQNDD